MNFIAITSNVGFFFIATGIALIVTWIIAGITRRVLGVSVGRARAFVVALFVYLITGLSLSWFAPDKIDPHNIGPNLTFFILAAVTILWGFALGAGLLVALEVIIPSGQLPRARELFFGWNNRFRKMKRTRKLLKIAAKRGLGSRVRGLRVFDKNPTMTKLEGAKALRLAFDDAGVTFVKLGQMLSTRPEIIGSTYANELRKLTTEVSEEPWQVVLETIEHALGKPIDKVFKKIAHHPIAAASVAQVHRATLLDGREVVVKVQRPGAVSQVQLDLEILLTLTKTLTHNAQWAQKLKIYELVEGFAAGLREELDYHIEVDNMLAIRDSALSRGVKIPFVVTEFCTENLIVMEYFDGTPVSRASDLISTLSTTVRRDAATKLLSAVLGQIIQDGIFHADLHSGNVLIWSDGSIGLLDFGSVGRLDAISRDNLALLFWSIDQDDPRLAMDAVLEVLDHEGQIDDRILERDIGTFMTRVRHGVGTGGSLKLFTQLLEVVAKHGFSAPDGIAKAFRSMGALEGTLRQLSAEIDLINSAKQVASQAIGEVSYESLKTKIVSAGLRTVPMLEHLPRRINQIGEDLQMGRFSINIRPFANPDDRRFVNQLVQQLVTAILAGSAAIAAVLLVISTSGPELVNGITLYQFIGYVLGFCALILSLRSAANIFWNSSRGTPHQHRDS